VPKLWTFENAEKLKPFITVLIDNDISFETLTKDGKVDSENGLIVSVDEYDFKRAKKELLRFRKRITNRNNR